MSRPNTSFEISVEEMEIIESALRAAMPTEPEAQVSRITEAAKARDIAALLGRLHNQKNFYRPRNRQYISG